MAILILDVGEEVGRAVAEDTIVVRRRPAAPRTERRPTPAPALDIVPPSPPRRGWDALRPSVEGEFQRFGKVFRDDPITCGRKQRRVSG